MKISQAFPAKYLKAADLGGRSILVKIDDVALEQIVENKEETKPVAYFIGKHKGLVLNKTNATVIASEFGDDTSNWKGKEIEVYPDKTSFQGQIVDCIRVRIPVMQAGPDEEVPF